MLGIHYYQPNNAGTSLQLPWVAFAWMPVSVCVGIGLAHIAIRGVVRYSSLTIATLFCCLLLAVPIFYSHSNESISLDRIFGLLLLALLFLSLQQYQFTQKHLTLLLGFILIGVWVEALFGWVQFLSSAIGSEGEDRRWTVPSGIFQQVNVMASFMATGLVLSLYLLATASDQSRWKWVDLLYIGMPLVTMHLLHALSSRTGWYGAFFGVLLILPLAWNLASRKKLILWIAMLGVGYSVSFVAVPSAGWAPPSKEILNLSDVRATTMPQTLDMIMERPLGGYGYGNFESSYLNFTAARHAAEDSYPPGLASMSHPHNELLYWTAEGGIVPLFGLLFLAYLVWMRVYKQELRTRLALVGLFLPVVLHSQLELPFYQSVAHVVVFVILIFYVDNLSAVYKEKNIRSGILIGALACVIPVVTIAFMATTLQSGAVLARFESNQMENVEDLTKMTNPVVWQDRLNWAIRSRLVVNGILSGQPELGQGYIDWVPDVLAREPRALFYKYLILAHEALGNDDKVREVTEEAYYLFPNDRFEIEEIAKIIARPVQIYSLANSAPS